MKIRDDWKWVTTKAWSMRFWCASFLLQVQDAMSPVIGDLLEHDLAARISAGLAVAGLLARMIKQERDQ